MKPPHIHEDPTRTTPIGLASFAVEFMQTALAADQKMGRRRGYELIAPVPVMFLVGQAIELTLKSHLLHKGINLKELRTEYGHGLPKLLTKAIELGLPSEVTLSGEEHSVIELLDDLYSTKQLQYIVTGEKRYPSSDVLQNVALKLIHAIGKEVGYRTNKLPTPIGIA